MSVYLIRKPYQGMREGRSATDQRMHDRWVTLLGEEHIAYLADPSRVVDVIFGILAKETGKIAEFQQELESRQTAEQVKTVYTALKTVHTLSTPVKVKALTAGKSTMHNAMRGKKAGDLL
jgi:hypothetical protein